MIKKEKDKIVIKDKNFDIKKILECGQVFSFCKTGDKEYRVVSMDKVAIVCFNEEKTEIKTKYIDYFYRYFDLDTDYEKINKEIVRKDKSFEKYIKTNLNILKQDPYQTIISFIVSANNNIKRIIGILDKICKKWGTFLEEYNCYSFPTLEKLSVATEEDFFNIGAGYRAKYLFETIKKLQTDDFSISKLCMLDSNELKERLLMLNGVGPKVADCILFFGFARTDFFPVDTWIRKAFKEKFPNKKMGDKQIAKYYVDIFKEFSGYAQQYLYNYMIENK